MVTIIIPTLGTRGTLDRAIQSVKDQTKEADYIVAYDTQRNGAGPTRNSVIEYVKTPWVGFVDDDDILDPHYAEWLAEEAEDNDVVVFHMQYMSQVLSMRPGQIIPRPENPTFYHGNVGISFAMKTALLKAVPFKREGTSGCANEDWTMIETLQKQGCKIKLSDRVAYYVRPA